MGRYRRMSIFHFTHEWLRDGGHERSLFVIKTRYNQHTSSFRLNHKKSATTLSEFIWKLKESKTEYMYHLSWDVIERAQPYSAATNRCNLCIAEKYFILKTKTSLNKRREIFSSCPHRKKHLLQNYQWPGNKK